MPVLPYTLSYFTRYNVITEKTQIKRSKQVNESREPEEPVETLWLFLQQQNAPQWIQIVSLAKTARQDMIFRKWHLLVNCRI